MVSYVVAVVVRKRWIQKRAAATRAARTTLL